MFSQDNTCPDLLDFTLGRISDTGLSPTMATLSRVFSYPSQRLRANPLSLAATQGISVDFFSSGYLDVSVPRVRLVNLCIQLTIPLQVGFPIRTSWDQSLFANSPRLFAGYNVLHRLCQPRHPSCALSYLTIQPEADRNLIRSRQYLLH